MSKGLKKTFRVQKSDSALLYFILEAHEGVTAYRTLDGDFQSLYRDIELLYTSDFCREVDEMLVSLGEVLSEPVFFLEEQTKA